MKTCPFCAEEIQDSAIVCKHCGRDLPGATAQVEAFAASSPNPPPTYCIKCGAKAKAIAEFCHTCGTPVYRGTSSEIPHPSPSQLFPPTATPVMEWYFAPWKKYAVFAGRARRKECWLFHLGNLIIVSGLGLSEGLFGIAAETDESVLGLLFQFASLVPTIAVGVRRMHDTDHSGWWVIAPIANVVFMCMNGTRGANRFGADPK